MKTNALLCSAAAAVSLLAASTAWFIAMSGDPGAPVSVAVRDAVPEVVGDEPGERQLALTAGYTAAPGSRLHFAFEMTNSVAMAKSAADDPSSMPFELHVAAGLRLTVLGHESNTLLVGWDAERVVVTSSTATTGDAREQLDELRTGLQSGCDVRLDATGAPRAIRFHAGCTPFARSFLRALVSALTFEFRSQHEWSTSLVDAMGEHGFGYRANAAADVVEVRRTREYFVPRVPVATEAPPPEVHGGATASFDAATGFWTAVRIDEAMTWSCFGGARVAATLRGAARLTAVDRVEVEADWDRDFVAFGDCEPDVAPSVDPMRAAWAERLAGRDERALLAELAGLGLDGEEAARARLELLNVLAELVREDPAAATRLGQMVEAATVSGQIAADVLAALGIAGHPEAQRALDGVFENGLVELGLRVAAVEAMVQLEEPTPELVDALQRSLHGAMLRGLGGSTMLALGAFGSRGAHVVDELLAIEGRARAEGVEPAWFEALGNTGDPSVLTLARRQLAAADPVERAWGLTAIRRVGSGEAAAMVQTTARDDSAVEVRRLAVEVAGESSDSWSLDLLRERAAADADVSVRRAACSGLLLRCRSSPAALATLQERAQREPDASLREELRMRLAAGSGAPPHRW
jgi:hypothetical protein